MFDQMIESKKSRYGRRSGRFFMLTTAVYCLGIAAAGVGAVFGFSPVLAEEFSLSSMLAPPTQPPTQPRTVVAQFPAGRTAAVVEGFVPPKKVVEIPDPGDAAKYPVKFREGFVPGSPTGENGAGPGVPGGRDDYSIAPPPPALKPPAAKPEPPAQTDPKPAAEKKVSEGVLRGMAIRRVTPAYPAMARQIRLSGQVQVQITISEEGTVLEAAAINGHPLLRSAALDAARQWLFTPTRLGQVPVKVQGLLTFEFKLQ